LPTHQAHTILHLRCHHVGGGLFVILVLIATEAGDAVIKEHIRLNIGMLKQLADTMPIAKTVLGQVRGVAQELFASRKALSNVYWANTSREEILQGMIEEMPLDPVAQSFMLALPHS
jgi:hypothetical protein